MFSLGRKQNGFTLIELIVAIVIVGILGVGTVNFIGRTTQGFADTAERQQLATIGWIVSEKLTRAVRRGLPNSFRVSADGQCLELVPTTAGTVYVEAPVIAAANTFEVVRFTDYTTPGSEDRVAIYPSSTATIYDLSASGVVSSLLSTITAGSETDSRTLTLASNHQFPADSPTRRLYVVQDPVMYCFESGRLNRYNGQGFNATMPGSSSAGTASVIGSQLNQTSFQYENGTLYRNAVLTFSFEVVGQDGDSHSISQEVQIRNVP